MVALTPILVELRAADADSRILRSGRKASRVRSWIFNICRLLLPENRDEIFRISAFGATLASLPDDAGIRLFYGFVSLRRLS